MPENTASTSESTDEATTDETTVETTSEETSEGTDLVAELEKWKALSRKNEDRAKANADKAKKFDEIEEANKSEIEKATSRAEEAEKEVSAAKKDLALERVARKHNLSDEDVALLALIPADQIEAQAEVLAKRSDPKSGSTGASAAGKVGDQIPPKGEQITSRDQLKSMSASEILQAEKEGRLDHLKGIK
jgi:hypothetical protein